MKTARFTDSQIIAILKQAEAGSPVPELCREHGISNAKLDSENAVIADWLVRLTNNQRNWGFGLSFCICAM
jgi:hypothetical protein